MSETSARISSSLALTERKPQIQKAGGCAGIFFQLFDWNRRFAKKKFFPKKLLPPARAKVSKKFNADEKLPVTKHLLIAADENRGGFPSKMKKKNGECKVGVEPKKHEMQAPGLVARLMGLDALPAAVVEHDKSDGSSPKDEFKGKGGSFGGGFGNVELSPEKANVRPQKLQRTGVSERKPATRFGAEALQIKNVLSRSRKHHSQPKLVSPVKSPKMGRHSSRLIDAAVRILEPGIQATNRARCSLSYPSSVVETSKETVMSERKGDVDLRTQHTHVNAADGLNAANSCRSCGNVFEHMDVRSAAEEELGVYDLPASSFRENFFRGLEESRPRPAVYLENENDVVLLKTRYRSEYSSQSETNRPSHNETFRNDMHSSQHIDQIPMSRIFTSQKAPSIPSKHRTYRNGQMLLGDRVPTKAKLATTQGRRVSSPVRTVPESKDFISLNRNMSQTRPRIPVKPDNSFEGDRRFRTGKNDSLATQKYPVRKRRTLTASRQADNGTSTSTSSERQRISKSNVVTGNGSRIRGSTVNQTCGRSRPTSQSGNKDTVRSDVVSFTFNSPVKSGMMSHNKMDVKRGELNCRVNEDTIQQELIMEEVAKEKASLNYLRMNGDALGALLEQKLKELTHQVETEAATGFMPSARTTASILQELISALTAERPISTEVRNHGADRRESECDRDLMDIISQASRAKRSSDTLSHGIDHFSPGCVLDASFSNESCISSSIDDNSVKLGSADADLSDSATSTTKSRKSDMVVLTDLVNHTCAMLQDVNCVHAKLTAAKRDYVQEIVLSAELLFGNAAPHSSSRFVDFLFGPFLDELEILVTAAWKNSIIIGIEVRKEENPLRRFLIDCLVECLDVKYSRFIDSGPRVLSRLPQSINAEALIKVFDEEVRRWINFAGKTTDEIIEREMSTPLGKWTDFDIEGYEIAAQINEEIVQSLVDEIMMDLCGTDELNFC